MTDLDNDDEEEKKENDDGEEFKGEDISNTIVNRQNTVSANSSTEASSAAQKSVSDRPINKPPPYLYTLNFNSNETLLMAGGAGRNEFRVFDWQTEQVVAMVNNIPKAILCASVAKQSDKFVFGSADSRIRMFDWTTRAKLE